MAIDLAINDPRQETMVSFLVQAANAQGLTLSKSRASTLAQALFALGDHPTNLNKEAFLFTALHMLSSADDKHVIAITEVMQKMYLGEVDP